MVVVIANEARCSQYDSIDGYSHPDRIEFATRIGFLVIGLSDAWLGRAFATDLRVG